MNSTRFDGLPEPMAGAWVGGYIEMAGKQKRGNTDAVMGVA